MIPILNISDFEQETIGRSFYSNNLKDHLYQNRNHFYKPHKHDFYLCVIFTEGYGTHDIDFTQYEVQPNRVFFLRPGQTHFWSFTMPPKGYILFHTKDFFELSMAGKRLQQFPFYYSVNNPPFVDMSPQKTAKCAQYFKEIYQCYGTPSAFQKLQLLSWLNLLYIDLSQNYTQQKSSLKEVNSATYLQTFQQLEQLISQHYVQHKSAAFYADQLHITLRHLNRITKQLIGKSPTDLITEQMVLEAKRLLVHTNKSLLEIALLLGYEDYSYFSKVFKQKTQQNPSGFRKQYLQ